MLTNVQINNFKSLVNLNLDIKPITVFIGPNGSGKSSVLQALAVLKQSIEMGRESSTIQASGKIVNLGRFKDISYQHNDGGTIQLHVGGTFTAPSDVEKFCDSTLGTLGYDLDCTKDGMEKCFLSVECGSVRINYSFGEGRSEAHLTKGNYEYNISSTSLRGIIPTLTTNSTGALPLNRIMENGQVLRNLINDFHLVPAARGIDLYGVQLRQASTEEFATSEGPLEQAIRLITKLNYDRYLADEVSKWTLRLIGKSIRQRPVEYPPTGIRHAEDRNVYASVEFIKDNIKSVAVNEGYGINQLVLLLTQLALMKQEQTIGVEEPEAHLHPKAQSDLAKILIEEVKKRNIHLIFTTHSEHMLYPFLIDIARKSTDSLKSDDVVIYYFEYDDNKKCSKATPLKIDDRGMIEGGLRGFFEEKIETLNEYIRALSNE